MNTAGDRAHKNTPNTEDLKLKYTDPDVEIATSLNYKHGAQKAFSKSNSTTESNTTLAQAVYT